MSDNGQVPFLDLVTPHVELEEELVAVFRTALRSAGFIGGPAGKQFPLPLSQRLRGAELGVQPRARLLLAVRDSFFRDALYIHE